MWNLFNTDSGKSGFRLEYMEVLNWGTFHNRIARIEPKGSNSLLTGSNGAGKTTFVHALLTLLVPEKRLRSYGHFSDQNNKKNARTEESYVLGDYGEIQEEGRQTTTTQQLRPDKKAAFSIMLACFKNSTDKFITVFQVRWFINGELKRMYGISHNELTIQEDFLPFNPNGDWKKILIGKYNTGVKKNIDFFDGPAKYADRLIKVLGMKSENALSLFNQIVGIKVLGDLDEFIKNHMLDYKDVESDFEILKNNFKTLLEAKNNIEKAALQIEMLKPIIEKASLLTELKEAHRNTLDLKDTLNFWLSEKKVSIYDQEIEKENLNLDILNLEHERAERELKELQEKERELSFSIERSEVGQQLKSLQKQINQLEEDYNKKYKKLESYNRIAKELNLPENPSQNLFYETVSSIKNKIQIIETEITSLDDELYTLKKSDDKYKEEIEKNTSDLGSLRNQSNNITNQVAQIRESILNAVNATKEEIPFIGEIIQVKSEDKEWESSIERLLHSFALRLIVPEKYYSKVNEFIHKNRLNGKVVYEKYFKETYLHKFSTIPENALYHKLDFNNKSLYWEWVENEIIQKYNYICTDDLEEFKNLKKGLLISGLNKSGDRHEKDDRPGSFDRKNYVLGWDNREKIKWLEGKIKELIKDKSLIEKQIKDIKKQKEDKDNLKNGLNEFKQFKDFNEIDWESVVQNKQQLLTQKQILEKSNDRLKQLQEQLDQIKVKIGVKEKEIKGDKGQNIIGLIATKARKEDLISSYIAEKNKALEQVKLKSSLDIDFDLKYKLFEERFKEQIQLIVFSTLNSSSENISTVLSNEDESLKKKIETNDRELEKLIGKFKYPSDEIKEMFPDWKNEVHELPETTALVHWYEDLYKKLIRDDLPAYEKKFDDYLSNTMKDKVAIFRENLLNWEILIEENIESLNNSLRKINFNIYPHETYIQLKYKKSLDGRIRDLRGLMEDAIPDVTRWVLDESLDYRKLHFEKIAHFINTLDKNESLRIFSLDVRNWKVFYAEEYYKETNKPVKTYVDMGKLSGGEKAQLTYTILGSAIAYQFGLTNQDGNSFRFIAVDESFSNQDDDKASYLMNLCEQLQLQLLVVTPSDKIHIVEPTISRVHFVQRKVSNESVLFDMPIYQFQGERDKWLSQNETLV